MNKQKLLPFILTTLFAVLFIWFFENSRTASFVFPFLISACMSVNALYCGKTYSLVSLLIIGGFSYIAFDASTAILFSSLVLTVTGIAVGLLIKGKKSQAFSICVASVGFFVLYVGSLIFLSRALGENAVEYTVNLLKPYFLEAFETSLYSARLEGMYSGMEEYLNLFLDSFVLLMPAIIILLSAVMGYVLMFVVSIILKLLRSEYKFSVLFSKFKADGITIIIYFISMLAGMFINNEVLLLVFNNIYTILQFILQICGLSLIDAFFIRKKLSLIPRIIVIMLIFFSSMIPVVAAILVILAALDANRDFRGLNTKND